MPQAAGTADPARFRPSRRQIVLGRGATYRLARQPIGDDGNVGGDLDVTGSVIVRGRGARTVIENGLGDPTVEGDGDRLFHVDPQGKGRVDVLFEDLTLARGDVGCAGGVVVALDIVTANTIGNCVEQGGAGCP